ncbi:hypothetical protein ELH91_31975 [Rhizobium leguminosarum]|uniref:hypothetical protein n=1 Tax=Rhizobium leguminosarum TaxID=384 RepID=UPI00102FA869|nr:hypothetical protein [Rhizobium leguminosarum]TAY05483.1 hypothetical protein ELH91_31975 [Rhizobium leguminosarum]
MAFSITVRNDGVDGTVQVTERVNLNEQHLVFDGLIEAGASMQVQCVGAAPKDFTWTHRGSGLSGGPETVSDGGELVVE